MKKSELIKHVAEQTGETQVTVKRIIDALDETLKTNARTGEETALGLLTVTVVKKEARMGRNPATGEQKEIPARNAIKVKVGKGLKDSANGVAA